MWLAVQPAWLYATLKGKLQQAAEQRRVVANGGEPVGYHLQLSAIKQQS